MKYFSVIQYSDDNNIADESRFPPCEENSSGGILLRIHTEKFGDGAERTQAVFSVRKKQAKKSAVKFVLEEPEWDTNNYVFAPAALYNGNRFSSICKEYPPMLTQEEARRFDGRPVLTDVPRLSQDGNGCVQLSVGDLSFPCIGYYSPKNQSGYLMFFRHKNELGDFGITVREDASKRTASFILSSPCVRTPYKYAMCTTSEKSDDAGAALKPGDTVTFSFSEYRFKCRSITDFFSMFLRCRQMQPLPRSHPNNVPWHYAFKLIEEKYNRRNWVEDFGFYTSSEAQSGIFRQWQTGWVGGAINTLPGLKLGCDETKEKSRRTLDFVFGKIQHKSGFLYGLFCDGRAYGDDFLNQENTNIVMSRKNADALYYLAKQMLFLRESGEAVSPEWISGLQRLAEAFLSFFENNGDIGQFIDIDKGKPYIGGSASGGLVCAGLALCASYFSRPNYLDAAQKIAEEYYEKYISKGFSNGGPGEILSCPDSESAFALLESFVTLYRCTKNTLWLKYAEDTAALCSSWCVGYDYSYSKDTQFFERGTATTGAVWANVQNKHAAPGICTMSGESFLHLYRATGNIAYLELLKDISHNLTQYLSTPENPIYASYVWHNRSAHTQKLLRRKYAKAVFSLSRSSPLMQKKLLSAYQKLFNPVGRINERVNLSDWEGKNNVGEVPFGSCWCEVSAMLTYSELPAVYIRPDTGLCFALDHIICSVKSLTDDKLTVELYNPTSYDADYRIFTDNSACGSPLPAEKSLPLKTVSLCAGERRELRINRRNTDV